MSRQNRNPVRERKEFQPQRDDAKSRDHYQEISNEDLNNEEEEFEMRHTSELDRFRLNDLYERSST